jgi:hypothetical protein
MAHGAPSGKRLAESDTARTASSRGSTLSSDALAPNGGTLRSVATSSPTCAM